MNGYGGYPGDGKHFSPDFRPMDHRVQNYPPNLPPMSPVLPISPPNSVPVEAQRSSRVRLYLCEHLRRQTPHIFAQGPINQQQKPNAKQQNLPSKPAESQQPTQVIWKGYVSRNGTKVAPAIATSTTKDAAMFIKNIEFINITHRLTLEDNFTIEPLAVFTLTSTTSTHKNAFDEHLSYYPKGKIGVCPIDKGHVIFFCPPGNSLFEKYSETYSKDTATCIIIKLPPKQDSMPAEAVSSPTTIATASSGNWLSQLSSMAKLLGT